LAEHQEEHAHAYVKISEADRRIGIAGEVDEHRTFDRRRHGPIAALPGRAGRTVTIARACKMFSVTGCKLQIFPFLSVSAGSRKRNTS
jgi:hypothetical protein